MSLNMFKIVSNFVVGTHYTIFYKVFCPSYKNAVFNTSAEFPDIVSYSFKAKSCFGLRRFFHYFLKIFNCAMDRVKSFLVVDCFYTMNIRGSIAILHLHPAEFFMKIERRFGRITGFAVISVKQIFYFFKFLLCKIFRIFEFDAQCKPLMGFERNIDKRFKYAFFKYNRNFDSHFISSSIYKYSTKEEGCQGRKGQEKVTEEQ